MSAATTLPTTVVTGPAADPHASEPLHAAAEISAELRRTAVEREAENAPPTAEIELLRSAGLLGVREPVELGGGGLSWAQILRLVREIAAGDTSIGQLLAYHHVNALGYALGGSPEQARELGAGTVREGWFWGDIANPLEPHVVLTRDGDGYRATGGKSFATGASVADRIIVFGSLDDMPTLFYIDKDRPGLSFDRGVFDFIGVRLSDSGSGRLENVRVEASELFGPPPGTVAADAPLPPIVTLFIVAQQSSLRPSTLAPRAARSRTPANTSAPRRGRGCTPRSSAPRTSPASSNASASWTPGCAVPRRCWRPRPSRSRLGSTVASP